MKNLSGIFNMKVVLVALFSLVAVGVNAQSSLVVSKGVQHVANKKKFEAEKQSNATVNVATVEAPQMVVSKGVHNIGVEQTPTDGNMVSKGFPYWTVSKGVVAQHNDEAKNPDYITRK